MTTLKPYALIVDTVMSMGFKFIGANSTASVLETVVIVRNGIVAINAIDIPLADAVRRCEDNILTFPCKVSMNSLFSLMMVLSIADLANSHYYLVVIDLIEKIIKIGDSLNRTCLENPSIVALLDSLNLGFEVRRSSFISSSSSSICKYILGIWVTNMFE